MTIVAIVQNTSPRALFRAILAATASVALLGFLSANLSPSTALRSSENSRALIATGHASDVVATPATMQIVPAGVLDRSAQRFIGTGDFSAGSWMP
jgi:hypothetical protein